MLAYGRAHPWLTREANAMLDAYQKKTGVGLKWGSRGSSV